MMPCDASVTLTNEWSNDLFVLGKGKDAHQVREQLVRIGPGGIVEEVHCPGFGAKVIGAPGT
jgi:hypothetical protein